MYSLSQKDEVRLGIGHWTLGIGQTGHWAYLTFLRTAIYRDRDHLESRRDRGEKGNYTKVINEYIEL